MVLHATMLGGSAASNGEAKNFAANLLARTKSPIFRSMQDYPIQK
jgi:hypothetical protein